MRSSSGTWHEWRFPGVLAGAVFTFHDSIAVRHDARGPLADRQAYTEAGSQRTFYLTIGRGRPLVLLHGAAGQGSGWQAVLSALRQQFHVVAPDIVGHGRSASPRVSFTRAFYSNWLKAFCDALDLEKPVIVGHSLGGAIALQCCLDYPGLAGRLVIVDSIGLGWPTTLGTLTLLAAMFCPGRRMALDLMGRVMFSVPSQDRVKKMRALLGQESRPPRGLRAFHEILTRSWRIARPFTEQALRQVRCRTLVIWGEKDHYFPISHAVRAVRQIPDSDLRVIPGAGHLPFFDQPATFTRMIDEFTSL